MDAQTHGFELKNEGVGRGRVRSNFVLAICSLTLLLNNGFTLIGISIFDPLMIARLHVSVATLKFGDTIALATVAIAAPAAGYLIDKTGPRLIFVAGLSLMALGMFLYTEFTTIGQIYATFVLFGLCLALSGGFACLIVVSDATKKHRGLAIGALLATASLGQAIAPVVLSTLQRVVGWKMAVDCIALIALGLIPFILVVIPKRLHAIASLPHGHAQLSTFGASIRLKSFWGLAIVGGIGYMAAIGISTNLVLFYTKDLHLTATKIGLLIFVQFSMALLAQLLMGYLCDLVNKRVMHAACVGLMAAGCCCLALERESLVFLAVVLFGVGWGGITSCFNTS